MRNLKNIAQRIFVKIGLILIFLIFFLVIAEFFFRMFRGPDSWLKITVGKIDKKFHHSFTPNTTLKTNSPQNEINYDARINNFGLRGEDITLEKPKGTMRILLVGDSFTFGVGAQDNETIPYYFEEIVKKKYSNDIEVINCGMGLLCTTLHYINIRDKYLQLSPDLVILLFDLTDLWDDWEMERQLIYDNAGKIVRCDPYYEYGKFNWWIVLREHSKFADWFYDKIIRSYRKMKILGFRRYLSLARQGKRAKGEIAKLTHSLVDPIAFDGLFFTRGKTREQDIRRHFQRTAKLLLMIRDMLKQKNIDFIMVTYPYGMYVGPDQWSKGRTFWGFEEGKTYTDYFCFELMDEFAKGNHIDLINLLPAFLENKDKKLFFDYDGHFTPTANKIVAETLSKDPIAINKLNLVFDKSKEAYGSKKLAEEEGL